MDGKTVLVTGGGGFLGSFLVRALKAQGVSICAPSRKEADLTKPGMLDNVVASKVDYIYHLAAWTQAGDFCLRHPGEQWLINQMINTNIVQYWQEHQPQALFVSMGTSCAYDPQLPLREENYLLGTPIESLYTYAMTKRMLLIGQQSVAKQYGLKFCTFVPSTLYGSGYHTDGRQMHFIFDLIRKILNGKNKGEDVVLWGDGHQQRELIFVEDFVSWILNLQDKISNDIVNLGAGEEYSIREFAQKICQIVGYDFAKIKFDTTRYVGAKSKCLDVTKLDKLLPLRRKTPLDEGLAQTVAWCTEFLV